jgi:DNA mismatch repair protein MutS
MTFSSILFDKTKEGSNEVRLESQEFFTDLNLDLVIDTITAGRQEYNLKPFFYTSLDDIGTIKYRHEIMRDLEDVNLFESIKAFAQKMRTMRQYLALVEKLGNKHHKQGWFLETVNIYCDAVNSLVHDLTIEDLKSPGLSAFLEYLTTYARSDRFTSLLTRTKKLNTDLSSVRYCLLVNGLCVKVSKYESEIDYSIEVEKTFEKFKQTESKDYRVKFPFVSGMNHVEANILDLVTKLYPEIFLNLDDFYTKNSNYLDETISIFDREVQFYLAYLEYVAIFKQTGLKFCYPQISNKCKEVYDYEGFDLALAYKLITEKSSVVCNDFYLKGKERVFVISGPNQGGKTTFARMFGQIHYLASLGCPVPGNRAKLVLFDKLFTHFEKEEDIRNLRGKLQDDLVRVHDILNQATANSIIIINEIFSSTTLKDAVFLSRNIMDRIMQFDLLCVCVTFIDELASLSDKTVSMVSTVVPENPALRTFKIVRRPADGLSYAISIAEKHRLTYDCLKERLQL